MKSLLILDTHCFFWKEDDLMSIRDILAPFALAVATLMLFRGFFSSFINNGESKRFVAPISDTDQKPLILDVDFADDEKIVKEKVVTIDYPNALYRFSSHGAILKELVFKRKEINSLLPTVKVDEETPRELLPFLVALDSKTPFYYTLKEHLSKQDHDTVTFIVDHGDVFIEKSFTVYKKTYQVDYIVKVVPKGKSVQTRLLWPSPYLAVLGTNDLVHAFVTDNNKFIRTKMEKLDFYTGFFSPKLFGVDDTYFIHAMIKDKDCFTKRAYYKSINEKIVCFLETEPIDKALSWSLSWYMGPKEIDALRVVDLQLEKTLDYGMLSLIAKGMMYCLRFINRYVHNYGLAIILLTVLVKLLLVPLELMGKTPEQMQEYQKRLKYIENKYKNDSKALANARSEMLQKHGNPFLTGCLPAVLQLPLFYGLYNSINGAIELYRAPFYGWIHDLSIPDPYYILPIIVCFGMLFSSNASENIDPRQRFVTYAFALIFMAVSTSMAAGLVLYIATSIILHVLQIRLQKAIS